ncbi:unnamed protein product [Urochloa humidicola]
MIRRFVNLVLRDYDKSMHSLHRLDVAKYLFYPTTADAEAANAKANHNSNGGGGSGGDKPKALPRILRQRRRLPEPSMRFSPFPPTAAADDEWEGERESWPSVDDSFILVSPGTSEGRILHATEDGRAVLYDADTRAFSAAVPSFPKAMGRDLIAFSVPGSGEFMDEKESLYVMRSTITPPPQRNPLRYDISSTSPEERKGPDGDFVVLDFNQPYKWQPLPPPPFAAAADGRGGDSPSRYDDSNGGDITITSSAVVGGGRTICVSTKSSGVVSGFSTYHSQRNGAIDRTYCLDTAVREWQHAGDWALPFDGRAEHVPELGAWIGLSSSPPHHLCAADLSAITTNTNGAPPVPQHVWDDFTPPPDTSSSVVLNRRFPHHVLHRYTEWSPLGSSLVNLGSGRFCILKEFWIRRGESVGRHVDDMLYDEEVVVLTGVEVLRGDEDGELRMVKHKSKRYELDRPLVL